ncbi:MAG: phage head closure protein [Rhodocyclaceae bacterium]|nr:phage head closure protein [Rhodocyclaceae bacterium]MCP5234795.1 phage head closure protein [Zoogloeaceae bacterium]
MNTCLASRLRRRITIEEPQRVQNLTTGAISETWAPVATDISAAIEPLSVRDFVAASSSQSKVSARITIRYRPGLRLGMRIVADDGVIYRPLGYMADPVSGREYITIPCETLA